MNPASEEKDVLSKRMLAAYFSGLLATEESSLSVAQLADTLKRNEEWIINSCASPIEHFACF